MAKNVKGLKVEKGLKSTACFVRGVKGKSITLYGVAQVKEGFKAYPLPMAKIKADGLYDHGKPTELLNKLTMLASEGLLVLGFEESDDPRSENYLWTRRNAGLQDRRIGSWTEDFNRPILVEEKGETIVVDRPGKGYAIDSIYSMGISQLQVKAGKVDVLDTLKNEMKGLGFIRNAVVVDNGVIVKVLDQFYGAVAQTRSGDTDFLVSASVDSANTTTTSAELLDLANFSFEDFWSIEGNKLVIDVAKASSRSRLANSSGIVIPNLLGQYKGFSIRNLKDGKTIIVYHVGKYNIGLASDDFEVELLVEGVVPVFEGKKAKGFKETALQIKAEKTDGISYMSERLAKDIFYKLEGKEGMEAAVQFRMASYAKGLMVAHPSLREQLNLDMLLFKGAVKGNISNFLKKGFLDFAVINRTKKAIEKPISRISSQALANNVTTPEQANAFLEENAKVWEKIAQLDPEALMAQMGTNGDISEGEINVDSLTSTLVSANVETAIKSGAVQKKVASLMKAPYAAVARGQYLYMEDAAFLFFTADPLAVVNRIAEGYLSATPAQLSGIKAGHAIIPVMKDGKLVLCEEEEAVGFRFPQLHKHEAVTLKLVNHNQGMGGTHGDTAYNRYVSALEKGFFEGCVIFSVLDLLAEAMSGADFDGDQGLFICNRNIVRWMRKENVYFLDYSLVDGKLVSGCPFGDTPAELPAFVLNKDEKVFAERQMELSIEGTKLTFNQSAVAEAEDKAMALNVIDKIARYFAMNALEGNDIGQLTNINATVADAISEAKKALAFAVEHGNTEAIASLEKEIAGLENLAMYMTVAIRWEIDKAKHGGAYKGVLRFVNVLLGRSVPFEKSDITSLEQAYDISLERLFINRRWVGGSAPTAKIVGEISVVTEGLNKAIHTGNDGLLNKVRKSRRIAVAKDELGGVYYDAIMSDMLGRIQKEHPFENFQAQDEKAGNLMTEVDVFLDNKEASSGLTAAVYQLLKGYWDTVSPLEKEYANLLKGYTQDVLAEVDKKTDFSKKTNAWIYAKVLDAKRINKDTYAAKVVAAKEEYKTLQAAFLTEANLLMASDGFGGALVFALAYKAIFDNNRQIEKRQRKVAEKTKTEFVPQPYTRFSSCFDIFATGAVNFLYSLKEETFVLENRKLQSHAVAYFTFPEGFDQKEAYAKLLTEYAHSGKPATLKQTENGVCLGVAVMDNDHLMPASKAVAPAVLPVQAVAPFDATVQGAIQSRLGNKRVFASRGVFGVTHFDMFKANVVGFVMYDNAVRVYFENVAGVYAPATLARFEKQVEEQKALEASVSQNEAVVDYLPLWDDAFEADYQEAKVMTISIPEEDQLLMVAEEDELF